MMCVVDYEIKPLIYNKFIGKKNKKNKQTNVYILTKEEKIDSCIYTKLFNLK